MRGLSDAFINDLISGKLSPLLDRIHADSTLDLQIREDYVNIYYRGGNLLKLAQSGKNYIPHFDVNYLMGDVNTKDQLCKLSVIQSSIDLIEWIKIFPQLKQIMDLYFSKHGSDEREAQQIMVRDNNTGSISRSTDYYICDIEYASENGRFDLVAVRWPSTGAIRKQQNGHRLAIIEAKFGDGSITGSSGIVSHVNDVVGFFGDRTKFQTFKIEMVKVFNQKHQLGLINGKLELKEFSVDPPLFILALMNHDPEKSHLHDELLKLQGNTELDIYISFGCFMGYGLYDHAVIPLEDALSNYQNLVFSDKIKY